MLDLSHLSGGEDAGPLIRARPERGETGTDQASGKQERLRFLTAVLIAVLSDFHFLRLAFLYC